MAYKINIEIETDNAAFYEDCPETEVRRILSYLVDTIGGYETLDHYLSNPKNLLDFNGNIVGKFEVREI